MKVVVGSTNPTKIKAVKEVLRDVFNETEFTYKDVDTGISDQPFGDEEMIRGAINRAKNSLKFGDIGVGIEGGIEKNDYGDFLKAWVVITDGEKLGIGSTPAISMPNEIMRKVSRENELGEVIDEILNREGISEEEGTFGVLTKNKVSRKKSFKPAIFSALSPFLRGEFYD